MRPHLLSARSSAAPRAGRSGVTAAGFSAPGRWSRDWVGVGWPDGRVWCVVASVGYRTGGISVCLATEECVRSRTVANFCAREDTVKSVVYWVLAALDR